jgi:hypothetical protein
MNEKKMAKIALFKAKQNKAAADALEARKQVVGMDIYVGDTEPDVDGNYVWIDTRGLESIE